MKVQKLVANKDRILGLMAQHYATKFKTNIMTSVDIAGNRLKPSRSPRPLIRTGRLLASIRVDGTTVRANVPYAADANKERTFMGMPSKESLREALSEALNEVWE